MNKYEIVKLIEDFAPVENAESWDPSGWVVDFDSDRVRVYGNKSEFGADTISNEVLKIMLCLTVTDDVVKQAKRHSCDMIVSHHPLFYVPVEWRDINIYSAHTNLDKANGGTTDTVIEVLGLQNLKIVIEHDFLRFVEFENGITVSDFSKIISAKFPKARMVNNRHEHVLQKVAFCAGSGSEFIKDAKNLGADCLVTGDLKFHTALDSEIVLYDIGHFESEIIVLPQFEKLLGKSVEIMFAQEQSPFSFIC